MEKGKTILSAYINQNIIEKLYGLFNLSQGWVEDKDILKSTYKWLHLKSC